MAEKLKAPRLTWRKQPNEKGLAAVCQTPRGYELRHAGVRLGSVSPSTEMGRRYDIKGWYGCGAWDEWGVPRINTCHTLSETMEEAKRVLMAHFRKYIEARLKEVNG